MPLGLVQGDCLAGPALAQRPLTDRLAQSSHVPQRRSRRTATATHRIQRISNRTGSAGIALNHHLPGRCPSRQTIEPATGHAAGKRPREVLRELLAGIVHGTGDAAVSEHQRQRVHGAVVVDGLAVIVFLADVSDHAAIRADVLLADARLLLGPGSGALCLLGHGRPSPSCQRVASAPSRLRCTVTDLPVVATTVQVSPSPRSITSPSRQGRLCLVVVVRAP